MSKEYLRIPEQLCEGRSSNRVRFVVPKGMKFLSRQDIPDCKNLCEVILPQSLLSIEDGVFERCERLERVVFPRRLIHGIGERTFKDCASLSWLVISGILEIKTFAFANCKSPKRIVIKSINDITLGRPIFDGCNRGDLTVEYRGTVEQFKKMDKEIVGQRAICQEGDYHHPTSSRFGQVKAIIFVSVFAVHSGKFGCTVKCADGELFYPSEHYNEWM